MWAGRSRTERSSGSLLRGIELWIMVRVTLSPAQPGAGSAAARVVVAAAAAAGAGAAAAVVAAAGPTLFGDGYSWVDNTDYVVIA